MPKDNEVWVGWDENGVFVRHLGRDILRLPLDTKLEEVGRLMYLVESIEGMDWENEG